MSHYTIKKELVIDQEVEAVFHALTTSEEIVKYYPLKQVVSDWQVGSKVLYKGEIEGAAFTDFGHIEILNEPVEYKYSYWSDNHGTPRTPENHLTIHYELRSIGSKTQLVMTQANIQSEEMYSMMNDLVWDSLLLSLKNHLESSFDK